MTAAVSDNEKEKESRSKHAYLAGNFWPVRKEAALTPCRVVKGKLPEELAGGQYLRNGGNAYFPPDKLGQGYHFFDGDGMIHGVFFRKDLDGALVPCYVNKFVQTDVLLASQQRGSTLLPTIASLIAPISAYPVNLLLTLMRTMSICYLSSLSRLSVANTTAIFHNRKLLATCESGPMMRLHAPELETQGWEVFLDKETGEGLGVGKQVVGKKLGKAGKMLEEWTTGHPKVCPVTGDLVFYGYNILAAPFVTHSVIRKDGSHSPSFKTPVPGINRPKMMHDFAVSLHHSIILDLPLTMDPLNIVIGKPMLSFNRNLKSRFGVVPRYYDGHDTSQVKWFEDDKPSLIFHTADAWDEGTSGNQYSGEPHDEIVAVNMYGCRFRTSKLVYAAGSMCGPVTEEALARELSDVVRLTYFRFSMSPNDSLFRDDAITHAFSLSAIPFEFPVVCQQQSMRQHRFIYGCTLRSGAFDAALEGAKIDCIIKMDVEALRKKGMDMVARNELDKFEDVDKRSVEDILEKQRSGKIDNDIAVFDLPEGHVGQEPAFILKTNAVHEDDGYLVFYIYDEAQLLNNGDAPDDSKSQLYVVDASLVGVYPSSLAVVAIVDLPSRVPYGLHSNFITAEQIESQIQANNTNASIIEDVIVKEGGSSDTLDLKPRLRRATVAAADRSEQLQRDLVHKAHSVNDATILLWIAALFWTLVHHIDCAVYSDRARSLRSIRHQKPTSCVQQMERPDLIRRRTISISSHSHVPDFSSEQS